MTRHVLRRVLAAILLIWIVASCAFVLAWAGGGDAASLGLGFGASREAVAAARHAAGLDRPLAVQYGAWLGGAIAGDLGTSLLYRSPVGPMVLSRALNTALLAACAFALALLAGLPPALLCAARPRSAGARAVRALSLLAVSVPPFVGALVLVLVAVRTGWLPAGGMTAAAAPGSLPARLLDLAWHLPVPALALALPLAATFERQQATALADALRLPAIVAARARGASAARVLVAHAWRLALVPVAALGGLAFGSLLGGSFVVEIVTAWPGLGRLTYDALRARDLPLVAGCAVAVATVLSIGLLLADLVVAWADPRTRDS